MGPAGNALRVLEAPPKACEPLGDLRFRALLSDKRMVRAAAGGARALLQAHGAGRDDGLCR